MHTTGTVDWFDAEEGVGAIRPDDGTPPCAVRSATLHDCGIASLSAGDRVRFRVREEDDERSATDLRGVALFEDLLGARRGPPERPPEGENEQGADAERNEQVAEPRGQKRAFEDHVELLPVP